MNYLFSPAKAYLDAMYLNVSTSVLTRSMVSMMLLRVPTQVSFKCMWITHQVKFTTHLVMTKMKVSSIKRLSIIRLELCGVQMLPRLRECVMKTCFSYHSLAYSPGQIALLFWLCSLRLPGYLSLMLVIGNGQ